MFCHNFYRGKKLPQNIGLLPKKENNHPIGENSSNLVALATALPYFEVNLKVTQAPGKLAARGC
jgi:hypothetical protein